ncbi:MAG TPA: hypothetical protein VHA12_02830 [Candidatus Nanoarchaeia archaeon]|nr:hypothetical protein [Candidatus Nanoarchaeia archaeon]
MFAYRETLRKGLIVSFLSVYSIYSSGCAHTSKDDYQVPLVSESDRYDRERKQNKKDDLLNKINPDIKDSVDGIQKGLEDGVGSLLPGKPKINKSKLVWTKTW